MQSSHLDSRAPASHQLGVKADGTPKGVPEGFGSAHIGSVEDVRITISTMARQAIRPSSILRRLATFKIRMITRLDLNELGRVARHEVCPMADHM